LKNLISPPINALYDAAIWNNRRIWEFRAKSEKKQYLEKAACLDMQTFKKMHEWIQTILLFASPKNFPHHEHTLFHTHSP
jgi:hypothetical protein